MRPFATAALAMAGMLMAPEASASIVLSCDSGEAHFEVLPPLGFNTYALGVSRDGDAVVGFSENGFFEFGTGLLWNDLGALTALPRAPGASSTDSFHAFEVSDPDPQSGVRTATGTSTLSRTYVRWVDGVFEDTGVPILGNPGTAVTSLWSRYPIDATPDGRILVGQHRSPGSSTAEAFRFDASTATLDLLPSLSANVGSASGVSDDGRVVGGRVFQVTASCPGSSVCEPLAAVWIDGVLSTLPSPSGAGAQAEVLDVSADGSVRVGWLADGTFFQYAAVWKNGQLTQLPMELPAERFQSQPAATGVTADGSVVVGTQNQVFGPAFVWDEQNGLRDLEVVLARDYGLEDEMQTWNLSAATGVTRRDDGSVVVVGYMWPASRTVGPGQFRGFRATLDVVSPCPDDDDDGLCNEWERQQYVDVDCDGKFDPSKDLELFQADPERKDVYVEVDMIQGTAIPGGAVADVELAFAKLPASLTGNPTGKRGIALHLDLDDPFLPLAGTWTKDGSCGPAVEFDALKAAWFGTSLERGSPELLAVKRRLFRYAILGGEFGDLTLGRGTPFGPDLVVSPLGTHGRNDWAGILMHEIGHTLGLAHGGPQDHVNYKPNYHSVMNYMWFLPANVFIDDPLGLRRYAASWVLDFARRPFAQHLDEPNGFDEAKGLGGPQGHGGHFVPVGPLEGLTSLDARPRVERERGPIDFDRDGVPNEAVSDPMNVSDVNPADPDLDPPDLDFLEATSDWGSIAIHYKSFFEHPNWLGAKSCMAYATSFLDEPTAGELEGLRVDMPIDCNRNGVDDTDELLAGTATDANDDALLDECEPVAGDCDGDDDVDLADRDLFVTAFGRSEGEAEYLECADLDGDRDVTFVDYQAWVAAHEAAQAAAAEQGACGSTGAGEMLLLAAAARWRRWRARRRARRGATA